MQGTGLEALPHRNEHERARATRLRRYVAAVNVLRRLRCTVQMGNPTVQNIPNRILDDTQPGLSLTLRIKGETLGSRPFPALDPCAQASSSRAAAFQRHFKSLEFAPLGRSSNLGHVYGPET